MARKDLSSLLDQSLDRVMNQPAETTDAVRKDVPNNSKGAEPPPDLPRRPFRESEIMRPRYLALDRKELRLRGDQADELSSLTRQLNRARRGTGERITDNTLIRIAIDLLLREKSRLDGVTEDQLRHSLLPD